MYLRKYWQLLIISFFRENKIFQISSTLIKLFVDNQDLFLEELKKEVFPNT